MNGGNSWEEALAVPSWTQAGFPPRDAAALMEENLASGSDPGRVTSMRDHLGVTRLVSTPRGMPRASELSGPCCVTAGSSAPVMNETGIAVVTLWNRLADSTAQV